MATLDSIAAEVRRLLGDIGQQEALYSDELIRDGVLEALIAILPWAPKECTADYQGNGADYEFVLPEDCVEIEAVWSGRTRTFLPRAELVPGSYWLGGLGSALEENGWLEYPHGRLSLAYPPQPGETLRVFYSAYWKVPADGSEPLEVPDYALRGIKLFTAAYAVNPKAASAANIRQFGTKVDSGTPVHNPMMDVARYFLALFLDTMSTLPLRHRGQKTR